MTVVGDPIEAGTPAGRILRFTGPVAAGDLENPDAVGTGQVLRLLTRQLFAYPAVPGTPRPVPDAARELPTVANGGLGADGRTYRIRLREGLRWDAPQARELTAADFVRGLKRTAHPGARAIRPHLAALIEGMAEYYGSYDAAFGHWEPDAPALAQFQRAVPVAGLVAADPRTLVVRLTAPSEDLIGLLATGWAAAAPRESDYHVPDSVELYRCCPSAGPYRVARRLSYEGDLVLEPNPRWDPDADPIRVRTARRIEVLGSRPGAGTGTDSASGFGVLGWDPTPADAWRENGPRVRHFLAIDGSPALRARLAGTLDRAALVPAVRAAGAVAAFAEPPFPPLPVPGTGLAGTRLTLANPAGERLEPLVRALIAGYARHGAEVRVVPGDAAVLVLRERVPVWPGAVPAAGPGELPLVSSVWPRAVADSRTGGSAVWFSPRRP